MKDGTVSETIHPQKCNEAYVGCVIFGTMSLHYGKTKYIYAFLTHKYNVSKSITFDCLLVIIRSYVESHATTGIDGA